MTLKEYLKKSRENAGLSQKEVANFLGYSSGQFVSNWERGLADPPVNIVKRLAKLYNVKSSEFLDIVILSAKQRILEEYRKSRA